MKEQLLYTASLDNSCLRFFKVSQEQLPMDCFLTTGSSEKHQSSNHSNQSINQSISRELKTECIADFAIRSKKAATCGMMAQGVFPAGFEINGTYVLLLTKRYFTLLPAFATTRNQLVKDTLAVYETRALRERRLVSNGRDKVRLFK